MFEYFKGKIIELKPMFVVIEVGNIAYFLRISLATNSKLAEGNEAKLYIHEHINARDFTTALFGFYTKEERDIFRLLISVSGVGAVSAITMLSSLSTVEIKTAILGNNIAVLQSIKGIGPKAAQRLVLDLRDKIGKSETGEVSVFSVANQTKEEAMAALIMLGYTKAQVEKAVDKILKSEISLSVEAVVKQALKNL